MNEIINFLTDFIRIDIFVGFGFYSIIYFLLKVFLKDKKFITDFDKNAVQLIIKLGIIWFTLWLIGIIVFYLQIESGIEKSNFFDRMFGKYWFSIWIQPIFWFALTQAYRIKFIKKYLISRIIISLLFVITFERFIIIITSLHRDYLPSSWSMYDGYGIETGFLITGLLGKILVVLIVFSLYHFGKKKLKNVAQQRTEVKNK